MKRILIACSLLSLILSGCVGMPATNTGALVGGVAGAALSRDNPIAGALIGGVGGAIIGNMLDNSGGRDYRHHGNRDYHHNNGYGDRDRDRAYLERIERQRAYEEQLRWQRLQQQRNYGGGRCYGC